MRRIAPVFVLALMALVMSSSSAFAQVSDEAAIAVAEASKPASNAAPRYGPERFGNRSGSRFDWLRRTHGHRSSTRSRSNDPIGDVHHRRVGRRCRDYQPRALFGYPIRLILVSRGGVPS